MNTPGEALVAITAIVVGCWTIVQIFKYGAQALGRFLGAAPGASEEEGAGSLTKSEVESMVRRVVREVVQQEVRPLREKLDRLDAAPPRQTPGRRGLPASAHPEDPHDFGLIAEDTAAPRTSSQTT